MWSCGDTVTDIRKHTKKPFDNQYRHLCVSFWYPTHMILVSRLSFPCRWSPIITIKVPNKGVVGGSKSLSGVAEINQNQTCQGSDTDTMSCLQYYSSVVGKSAVCKRNSVFFGVTSVNLEKKKKKVGGGSKLFFFLSTSSRLKESTLVDSILLEELTSCVKLTNLTAWFVVGVKPSHQVVGVGVGQAQEAGLGWKARIVLCLNICSANRDWFQ